MQNVYKIAEALGICPDKLLSEPNYPKELSPEGIDFTNVMKRQGKPIAKVSKETGIPGDKLRAVFNREELKLDADEFTQLINIGISPMLLVYFVAPEVDVIGVMKSLQSKDLVIQGFQITEDLKEWEYQRKAVRRSMIEENTDRKKFCKRFRVDEIELKRMLAEKISHEETEFKLAKIPPPAKKWESFLSYFGLSKADAQVMGKYGLTVKQIRRFQKSEKLLRSLLVHPRIAISEFDLILICMGFIQLWANTPTGKATFKSMVDVIHQVGDWEIKYPIDKPPELYLEDFTKVFSHEPVLESQPEPRSLACKIGRSDDVFVEKISDTDLAEGRKLFSFGKMMRNFLQEELGAVEIPHQKSTASENNVWSLNDNAADKFQKKIGGTQNLLLPFSPHLPKVQKVIDGLYKIVEGLPLENNKRLGSYFHYSEHEISKILANLSHLGENDQQIWLSMIQKARGSKAHGVFKIDYMISNPLDYQGFDCAKIQAEDGFSVMVKQKDFHYFIEEVVGMDILHSLQLEHFKLSHLLALGKNDDKYVVAKTYPEGETFLTYLDRIGTQPLESLERRLILQNSLQLATRQEKGWENCMLKDSSGERFVLWRELH